MMHIDTRQPLIVLLGAWNPAIFTPQWSAAYLYEIPDGTEISVRILVNEVEKKRIVYISNDIGYCVQSNRFEVYANSFTGNKFDEAARIAKNLRSKLPHTPMFDFGINFHFLEQNPTTDLFDKLTSNDQIDLRFELLAQEFMAKIKHSENCQLNFKRISTNKYVALEFNYHHSVESASDLDIIDAAHLRSLLEKSKQDIIHLYDVESFDEITHSTAVDKGGEETT